MCIRLVTFACFSSSNEGLTSKHFFYFQKITLKVLAGQNLTSMTSNKVSDILLSSLQFSVPWSFSSLDQFTQRKSIGTSQMDSSQKKRGISKDWNSRKKQRKGNKIGHELLQWSMDRVTVARNNKHTSSVERFSENFEERVLVLFGGI